MNKIKLALLCGLALAGANAMACYTVYDHGGRVLYRGMDAPVDMAMQLHDALAARGYPAGSRMQFDEMTTCSPLALGSWATPTGTDVPLNTMRLQGATATNILGGPPAPLLTDRATAQRSHLPHTEVAGDIVMVPPAAAERAIQPTVTVLPSSTYTAAAAPVVPDTRALGAGPANYAGTTAVPATTGKREVVITELRDPPVTIEENNGRIVVSPAD